MKDRTVTVAARHPELLTTEQRKNRRADRVFLDHLRNAYGQTAVAPTPSIGCHGQSPRAAEVFRADHGRG